MTKLEHNPFVLGYKQLVKLSEQAIKDTPMPNLAHGLKIWPLYFDDVRTGRKTFEIRENDRDFHTGDTLVLNEWDNERQLYTGRSVKVKVTYLLRGGSHGLHEDFVALGIKRID